MQWLDFFELHEESWTFDDYISILDLEDLQRFEERFLSIISDIDVMTLGFYLPWSPRPTVPDVIVFGFKDSGGKILNSFVGIRKYFDPANKKDFRDGVVDATIRLQNYIFLLRSLKDPTLIFDRPELVLTNSDEAINNIRWFFYEAVKKIKTNDIDIKGLLQRDKLRDTFEFYQAA